MLQPHENGRSFRTARRSPARRQDNQLEVDQWFGQEQDPRRSWRGFVVLLLFFQINCPLSLAIGLPQFERLRRRYSELPVKFLGIHSTCSRTGRSSASDVQTFIANNGFSFPVCMDRPGTHWPVPKTMHNFSVERTPTLVILDPAGTERFRYSGLVSDFSVGVCTFRLIADEMDRVLRPLHTPSGKGNPRGYSPSTQQHFVDGNTRRRASAGNQTCQAHRQDDSTL